MDRRNTRSNSIPHDGTDAQFWAAQPNPRQIERGHAEAVALTRAATRTTIDTAVEENVQSTVREELPPNEMQEARDDAGQTSHSMEEHHRELQMRTSAMEEGASFLTGDISSEVNATKQEEARAPVNTQQYRESPAHYTAGTPTETGTPEQPLANSMDGYLGDGLEDVLQNSHLLQGSFTALLAGDNQTEEKKPMPLAWVVPDTTNRILEEIEERTIADFRSPGGGTGALVILLPRLSQFYHTDRFTVDIDSGEVFAYTGKGWHPAGLRCQHHHFNLNILGGTILTAAQHYRDEISSTEQTKLVDLSSPQENWPKPPELPPMGDAALYITYPDVMQLETRKRYVKDRTQAGITYIVEHSHTLTLKGENRYHEGMLDTRLNIIFGRAQAIREQVDEALRLDDMYRRRRNMRTLMPPTRFPDPANMARTSNDEWLRWMRHEMFALVDAIDAEKRARRDDDNPFNGTAGGVFQPLPLNEQNTNTPEGEGGTRSPQEVVNQEESPERVVPVQTIRPTPQVQRETRWNTMDGRQPQADQVQEATPANTCVQTPLIHPTVTVERQTNGPNANEDEILSQDGIHRMTGTRRSMLPDRQQPVIRERLSNGYQSGYRQRQYEDRRPPIGARRQIPYDQMDTGPRTQEWPDRSRVLNNTSYLQFPQQNRRATGDNRTCNRCGMQGHIRRQCQLQVAYCTFCNAISHTTGVCRARAAFVRDNPVSSSRRTSPNGIHPGNTANTTQEPRARQSTNHTSQWSVEPATDRTQGMENQVQMRESEVQQNERTTVTNTVLTREGPTEGPVQRETDQRPQIPAHNAEISSYQPQYQENSQRPQIPTHNAEISSYQPQYQENRMRNTSVQERPSTVTLTNQQRETQGVTGTHQPDISPQLEALQAQINVLQLQLAQQNQRGNQFQQSMTMDPLMVVGPWQHTEQQPAGGAQLMGQPHHNQGNTHHIQPTVTNTATGRSGLVLNTTIPPPTIQAHPNNETDSQASLLRSVREITETMQQHIVLSGKQTEYSIGQNALLVKELIKSNDRRDLDDALAAIPTFMGTNKEECIEWLSRIKNVCNQTGRNFRQELVNKAGLTVQTFINSLGQQMGDQELSESIMQFFSSVPTVAHAVEELKKLQQGETEPIISYNQKYKNLVERVEARPVDEIKSIGTIEAYLGSLIEPIRKAIRGTLFWDTQYALTNLGEAMRKAQDLHVKYYYTTGRKEDTDATKETVTIHEIGAHRDEISSYRYSKQGENQGYNRDRQKGYQSQMWRSRGREAGKDEISSSKGIQHTALRNAYTQVLVNPIQLSDDEFAAWMGRIVDARRLRLEKKPRPYRDYRKDLKQPAEEGVRLTSKLKPAEELNVEEITRQFKCTPEDIEEAVEMYNLDVDDYKTL